THSLRTAFLQQFKSGSVMLVLLALLALALAFTLLLAVRLRRRAASSAERLAAGGGEPCLVLEQAGCDLGTVWNEFAANALCIARARVLAAALHVVGTLRPGRRSAYSKKKRSPGACKFPRCKSHLRSFSLA